MKKLIYIVFIAVSVNAYTQTDTLTLEKAIATALKNNYGIIIQNKQLSINQENNTWGNAGALPNIKLSGNASETWSFYEEDNASTSSQAASVNLEWVVFRGFSAKIQKSRLNEMEKLSETNLALTTENTIINLTLAYYNSLLQHENMKSAEQIMSLSEDRYKKEKLKMDLGSTKTYDVLQAQNAWLEDRSTYLSAKTNYNNSIRQLNYLMAISNDNTYSLELNFEADTTSFDLQVLSEKMLSNNNTLKNQYINLEMARLEVKSAKSAFYPTVTAGANGGYNSSSTDYNTNTALNQSSNGYSTGISAGISYTLFEGGQRKTALRVAKIEEEIGEVETQQMKDELKNQLAQEFELYEVRKELLKLAQENLNAANLNMELSTKKYENGSINSFNFRDIQQLYINSVVNFHSATYNAIESYNTLLQLTGGIIEAQEQ